MEHDRHLFYDAASEAAIEAAIRNQIPTHQRRLPRQVTEKGKWSLQVIVSLFCSGLTARVDFLTQGKAPRQLIVSPLDIVSRRHFHSQSAEHIPMISEPSYLEAVSLRLSPVQQVWVALAIGQCRSSELRYLYSCARDQKRLTVHMDYLIAEAAGCTLGSYMYVGQLLCPLLQMLDRKSVV